MSYVTCNTDLRSVVKGQGHDVNISLSLCIWRQGLSRSALFLSFSYRRYDTMIFTCTQKLTYSQLNLPHGTKQKRIMKKVKIKTEMLRRNGPVIKPWSQS